MASLVINARGEEKEVNQPNPIFPDKKERKLDYDRVTAYLQEGREIAQDFEVGQREATWIPRPEFPDLPIMLSLVSDMHYGSTGVDYERFSRYLDIVENTPNFYMADNGDSVDSFNAIFHASGMTENPLPPQIQSRAISNKLRQLDDKNKIALISHGNHNDSGLLGGQDWYDSFLSGFQCPIFTSGGILNVDLSGYTYRIVLNHTYWGKSKLNPVNAVKRLIEYEGGGNVDIGWLGHVHQSDLEHFERGGKDVLGIIGGTHKVDDTWASRKGIGGRGQTPGICVMLFPGRRVMEAFKNIEVAKKVMDSMIYERQHLM